VIRPRRQANLISLADVVMAGMALAMSSLGLAQGETLPTTAGGAAIEPFPGMGASFAYPP